VKKRDISEWTSFTKLVMTGSILRDKILEGISIRQKEVGGLMMQSIVKEIFKTQLLMVMPEENEASETSAKK
jgi:hypothetical protein